MSTASHKRFVILSGLLCVSLFTGAIGQDSAKAELFQRIKPGPSDLTPKQQGILSLLKDQKTTSTIEIVKLNATALADSQNSVVLNVTNALKPETKLKQRPSEAGTLIDGVTTAPTESVQMVNRDGNVTATIRAGGKLFLVRPIGGGLHALIQQDESKLPREHPPEFEKIEKAGSAEKKDVKPMALPPEADADPAPVMRVLVAYTAEAAAATVDMPGLIALAIAETNTSYKNSKIKLIAELADSFQVDYKETGSFDTDLEFFKGKNDQKMDEVHTRRDQSKADVCVLLVAENEYCGLAAAIGADEVTAFAAVSAQCATGYYSFGHEIGHLQGARHNPEMDSTSGYGHGYFYEPGQWRTVMSYACPSNNCTRIQYWSNPNVSYNGVPTGKAGTNDNARMLNETAKKVSQFRN